MSKCFHCGEISSDLETCSNCQNNYCKFHVDPVIHECRLTIESSRLQHEYNVAMHPDIVERNNPNFLVRGSTDGSYTWDPPETVVPKKKLVISNKFVKTIKEYETPLFLLVLIVLLSFISLDWWNRQYINLSSFGLFLGYYWTFITSLFVFTLNSIEGILFFVIDLVFMFMIINKLEKKTSGKLVYSVFGFSGFFSGVIFLLIRGSFAFLIPIGFLDLLYLSVGLGGAGFLGLTAFSVFLEPDVKWNFYIYGIPIKVKGRNLLLVIVALRLIPSFLYGFFPVLSILTSCFEIIGILAGYICFKCWKKFV